MRPFGEPRTGRERGSGLLELMMAVTVLAVGLLSMATGFYGAAKLNEVTRDDYALCEALQNATATLKANPLATLPTTFGESSGRKNFYLNGDSTLAYSPPTGCKVQGSFEFYTGESSLLLSVLGLSASLDLNANGLIDLLPVNDYKVLPSRVNLTVNRAEGNRTLAVDLIIAPKTP